MENLLLVFPAILHSMIKLINTEYNRASKWCFYIFFKKKNVYNFSCKIEQRLFLVLHWTYTSNYSMFWKNYTNLP